MPDDHGIPLRYALRTRSRHEKLVRGRLAGLKIEQLLPTVTRLSQWKDRKKEIEAPLFPGYCFARLEGIRGILLRKGKRHRLVISVHLIQQAAAVVIDADAVMPI